MFQLIIASNEEETYTVFLFPESGVEWVRGTGKNRCYKKCFRFQCDIPFLISVTSPIPRPRLGSCQGRVSLICCLCQVKIFKYFSCYQ